MKTSMIPFGSQKLSGYFKKLRCFSSYLALLLLSSFWITSNALSASIDPKTETNNHSSPPTTEEKTHHSTFCKFDSGEHALCGDSVYILFPTKKPDGSYEYIRRLGNGVDFSPWLFPNQKLSNRLSYGMMVSMPDFFANPKAAISDGTTLPEQQERFITAFNIFLTRPKSIDKVLNIINEEIVMIQQALASNIQPSVVYKQKGLHYTIKYLEADPFMAEVLLNMIDHFGGTSDHDPAWIAYQAGHEIALEKALKAHETHDVAEKNQLITLAFAINGYACHFLSDRFAAGHMRPPFRELQNRLGGEYGVIVGGLLVNSMHNEDNLHGLEVTNKRGDKWQAYGDSRYSDEVNKRNKELVIEALQLSADEITYAFEQGSKKSWGVEKVIVDLDVLMEFSQYIDNTEKTISLFAYDQKTGNLLRRHDINRLAATQAELPFSSSNMKAYGGLTGWYGLTTLLELKLAYHPHDTKVNSSHLTSDGQLNEAGKKHLGGILHHVEKTLICAHANGAKLAKELGINCDDHILQNRENLSTVHEDL